MVVIFMYGTGADGPAAWPAQMDQPGHRFLERPGLLADDPQADAVRILSEAGTQPVHVVAASYGGMAATLAAHLDPSRIVSLALLEPACADLALHSEAVRSLQRTFEPVLAMRDDHAIDDVAYAQAFRRAMGLPRTLATPSSLGARRLRRSPLPWEVSIPDGRLQVPTLVATGGWSDFYEDIAHELALRGAMRVTLSGFGHDVIRHPEAIERLAEFRADTDALKFQGPHELT